MTELCHSFDRFYHIDHRSQQQLLSTLQSNISAENLPECILYQTNTNSTNDDALLLFQNNYHSALVVSQQQQQGRGQQQRQWYSQQGNLFLSLLIPIQRPLDGRFALECGYFLCQIPSLSPLHQHHNIQLKWANDLYSPHGKWGGILIEPIHPAYLIVGIGINLIDVENHDIQQPITSLKQLGLNIDKISKYQMISEIYQAILYAKASFEENSPHLANRIHTILAFKNKNIILQRQYEHIYGQCLGIQDNGAILIQHLDNQQNQSYYDGRLFLLHEHDLKLIQKA